MNTMEKSLQGLLSRHCEFRLAILFGSQATDSSRADSDIDLALLADTQISSSLKLELIEAIGADFVPLQQRILAERHAAWINSKS